MKLNRLYFLLVVLLLGHTNLYAQVQESMYGDAVKADVKVDYVFSYEEALKKARAEHKLIFFNCFSDWAVPCHAMNQQVFSDQAFGDWLNEHFVNLWVEMTTEAGLALSEKYGVGSMPYYLVLDENGDVVHRLASGCALPEFQKRVACALSPKTSYKGMNEAYQGGKQDKKFLREYASVLRWAGEDEKYEQIADQYFQQLKPSQWCKKENWQIFSDRLKRPDSLLIDYLFAHKADFVKESGEEVVNNAIVSLYYADAMAYAAGSKPYTKAAGLEIFTQLQKGEIPDTNDVYKFLEIASLRHDKKYAGMLDYLAGHIGKMDSRVAELLDMSLGNLPEMEKADREMVAAYLEKRMEGGDEYLKRHYGNLVNKLLHFKGMVFEDLTLEQALAKAREEGKFVFMDCYTTWCGPCKMMESQVFSQEAAGQFCNTYFVNIKVDMEKGEGIDIAKRYGVSAFPTMFVLDANGAVRCRMVGSRNVEDFLTVLRRGMNDNFNYSKLKDQYVAGERSAAFLCRYYLTMYDAGEMENMDELHRFLMSLKDSVQYTPEAWFLYNLLASDVNSPEFAFLLEHREKFADTLGRQRVERSLQNVVFPVYVDYLLGRRDKADVDKCHVILAEAGLPEGNALLLLDNLVAAYDGKDFAGLTEIYKNQVSAIADAWLRLNLDALLDIFVKDAPKDTQKWALEYIKEALGKAEPAAINKYSELVNDLTKFVEGK